MGPDKIGKKQRKLTNSGSDKQTLTRSSRFRPNSTHRKAYLVKYFPTVPGMAQFSYSIGSQLKLFSLFF